MTVRLEITRLGAQGDGVAETERGQVFVPFTLPGEVVNAAIERERGTLMALIERSALRVEPPCRHFGECGGCVVQHLEESAYRDWKRGRAVEGLRRERVECEVGALVPCAADSRRRVVFSARRSDAGLVLGYHRMQSSDIVDISECRIALPEIVAALPNLRELAGIVCQTTKAFHISVTATATGLDVAFLDSGALSEAGRRLAANFVIREKIARLSIDGEIVVEPQRPVIHFGDVAVTPPPGGFIQAVKSAEEAMVDLVTAHMGKSKKVADLFAGSGAFSLRLARRSEVHAVEGDAAALAALDRGFRFATGLKRVTQEKRDLFRRPMTFKELNLFDGVVFDPPRAGAEDQSIQLARSDVPLVAAVSCNPTTLARDLRILIDGGYTLKSVTPIDQFLWSPHVEAVALLEKKRKRR
ncbi:MAG: class I SAM-dependent RNA methyltransferase [Mesorhizobium sp.]|nr:class I SAM-dependent RNA methyltransferase [Mesorhizobium sp.]